MKEILFRGKRKDNGDWIYGYYCKYGYTGQLKHYIIPDCASVLYSYEAIPETVGQYTGLTDKNGKKIFEGDIVRVERDFFRNQNGKEREIFNAAVCYDENSADFGLKGSKYTHLTMRRFDGDFQTVIGNIYDNPELLKGGAIS